LVGETLLRLLAKRDRRPELMDQPGLDANIHRRALAGLRTTNAVSGIARIIWRAIADSGVLAVSGQTTRILDVAAGGGDVLLAVAQLAARNGAAVEPHGCDISPTAVEVAQQRAAAAGISNAKFFRLNALADPLPGGYDIVMCTLFLHHLTEADIRQMLGKMANAARRLVVVDDLRRNWLGYAYAWLGGRILTRSHIVHTDGPLSVRAAFTSDEFRQLATDAGLGDATFHPHWPQRFLMTWKRP
jgi:2-polyprenyl-3-methyl-5-hydroxy-6-metoxy-1,4-benzoquinol methylase